MTLKTDFSDGDIFYTGATSDTDKLNGITNTINTKSTIHTDTYTSAAEDTDTSGAWADSDKTFALAAPIGSYLIGIYFTCELGKTGTASGTDYAHANLKLNGTNLGSKYIVGYDQSFFVNSTAKQYSEFIKATEDDLFFSSTNDTTYRQFSSSAFLPIEILDTSTTFTVRIKNDSTDGVKIQNVNIVVMYSTPVTED